MDWKPGTDRHTHRHTPVTYSAQEATALRKAFARGDGEPLCPRCGGEMLLQPPFEMRGRVASELYCEECCHCVIVRVDGPHRGRTAGADPGA